MQRRHNFSQLDDQETTQLTTRYPLSRKQGYQLFRNPVDKFRSLTYDVKSSIDRLCKKLQGMKRYDYEFDWKYSVIKFDKANYTKSMRRKVNLSFYCERCVKKFNSLVGTYEIIFKINGPRKFRQNDPVRKYYPSSGRGQHVDFCAKIYQMECTNCNRNCEGKIYDSQLEAVAESFCILLSEIFDNVPMKTHYDDRNKLDKQAHFHKVELCQACKDGVCYYAPKGQTRIKESDKIVPSSFRIKESDKILPRSFQQESQAIQRKSELSSTRNLLRALPVQKQSLTSTLASTPLATRPTQTSSSTSMNQGVKKQESSQDESWYSKVPLVSSLVKWWRS